jgi:nucleotide-binding universal stress UspA family protein
MNRIVAALDNSMAAQPAMSAAVALGSLVGDRVEAVHVSEDGDRIARGVAEAAGLELKTETGPVIERLIEIAREDDVDALVLGARSTPAARRPLGGTARALATSVAKPVVVVPPNVGRIEALESVLVPVEGTVEPVPRKLEEMLRGEEPALEVIVLHVYDESTLPSFTDQPQHEHDAWAREFLKRHCPWEVGRLRLEVRMGKSEDVIPRMVRQTAVDLVAVGWGQEIGEGRAPVVRALLTHGRTPVMLVPAEEGAEREEAIRGERSARRRQRRS